jgi:hypothetical protein
MRTMDKMTPAEELSFIRDIKTFDKLFDKNTVANSVTIKTHHLFEHIIPIVRMCGTIGFFAEDGLESIHVLVNKKTRMYQTFKGVKQWERIIQSKAVASMRNLNQKRTQKDQKGGAKKKQKVRQDSNKFGIAMAAPSDVITEQIYAATAPLRNWASDEQGELARLPMRIVNAEDASQNYEQIVTCHLF